MATIPPSFSRAPGEDHDQDAEPPTPAGGPAERVDPDDTTPGSDPDPEPGQG